MKKRILLVHTSDFKDFPPVRSLLENLLHNGHTVTMITKDSERVLNINAENLQVIRIKPVHRGMAVDLTLHYQFQRALRNKVRELMRTHDVLWTTTDTTVRELGDTVLEYRHVMQLLELIEDIPLYPYQSLFKLHISRYAQQAWKVVTPEYNRAQIQKVWWGLSQTPVVLPNKPYTLPPTGRMPKECGSIVDEMRREGRRIVLYQGVFDDDRNLVPYAEALRRMQKTCCFYVMGRDNDIREELCRSYPEIRYIPFLAAPNHLYVTKEADIGLLPYIPVKTCHYSELNALYCAPNKIYEYAAYGLPMVGSDVPGLELPFRDYGIGVTADFNPTNICRAIERVERNYEAYSANCARFFQSADLDEIVEHRILEE